MAYSFSSQGGATYFTFQLQKKEAFAAAQRAAKFEKEAADANLKAELLKKELGWREVTATQADRLRSDLRGQQMPIAIHWGLGDAEGSHFAHALAEALNDAGQKIAGGGAVGQFGEERHGISVAGWQAKEVKTLAAALKDAGYDQVEITVVAPPKEPNASGQYTDIFVGYRSAPKF